MHAKSKCTGRFPKSYPAYDQRLFELSGFNTVSDRQITLARKLGGAQLARMLAPFKGQVAALASCTYEPYYSRNLCGKTFRGALRLVSPEGRAVAARSFAVTWKAREC